MLGSYFLLYESGEICTENKLQINRDIHLRYISLYDTIVGWLVKILVITVLALNM